MIVIYFDWPTASCTTGRFDSIFKYQAHLRSLIQVPVYIQFSASFMYESMYSS